MLLCLLAALAPPVSANGLTTHVWVAMQARTLVPEGDLHDLVNDPELETMLRNGTQFPDGGYALGDGYAEIAHWEPLQSRYLDWIVATYGYAPYTDPEARQHVAFLLGMGAHGISDQTFDSMYIERGRVYDAEDGDWAESFDETTDIALSAGGGAQPVPDLWVPTDALIPLFALEGHEVSAETLLDGQRLTGIAIAYVGAAGQNEAAQASYRATFPWMYDHIFDASVPGSPPNEAIVTALYWQQVYARLEGTWSFDEPLMATHPPQGALGHATSAADIESRVTFQVTRGLATSTLLDGTVTVTDSTGKVYVPNAYLYYGYSSHTINLHPNEDWAANEDFTVTVAPGLVTLGGDESPEPFTFTFSTRPAPEDTGDTGLDDTGDDGAGGDSGALGDDRALRGGCGCASPGGSGGGGAGALLVAGALLARRRGRAGSGA